jgi:hypothetical protein
MNPLAALKEKMMINMRRMIKIKISKITQNILLNK